MNPSPIWDRVGQISRTISHQRKKQFQTFTNKRDQNPCLDFQTAFQKPLSVRQEKNKESDSFDLCNSQRKLLEMWTQQHWQGSTEHRWKGDCCVQGSLFCRFPLFLVPVFYSFSTYPPLCRSAPVKFPSHSIWGSCQKSTKDLGSSDDNSPIGPTQVEKRGQLSSQESQGEKTETSINSEGR